jgi:ornithine--oxo-acid transaminase
VLGVLQPGEHGSTFGSNPLACAVGRAVIALLASGDFQSRSQQLGAHLHARLQTLPEHRAAQVTGRGLWAGVHIAPGGLTGREAAETSMARGVLCTSAHGITLRIALPLIITRSDLDLDLDAIIEVLMR